MLRTLGINLSLFGCTMLAVWACMEIGFALAAPQVPIREPLMYAPHPVLRYVPNPGTNKRYRTTEFDNRVSFNTHGFRNEERPIEKPPNTFRILCLGDSFTLGAEVAVEDSYAYLLEQQLNERAMAQDDSIRYEVMNGGVGGYGTFQELLYLQEFGLAHQPDLVLVQFYSNDVRDNIKYQEFWNTVYPDSSIFLSDSRRPFTREQASEIFLPFYTASVSGHMPAILGDVKTVLEDHSHVYHFLRARFNILKSVMGLRPLTDFDDFMVMAQNPSPDIEEGWELTRRLYLKIRDAAQTHQAAFALMVVPNKAQVAQNESFDTWIAEQKLDMTKPVRILQAFGEKHQIPVLDLLPDLQAAGKTQSLYYDWDGHWNAQGNRASALAIADFLEAQRLIYHTIKE